jgi:hypothetical protein
MPTRVGMTVVAVGVVWAVGTMGMTALDATRTVAR